MSLSLCRVRIAMPADFSRATHSSELALWRRRRRHPIPPFPAGVSVCGFSAAGSRSGPCRPGRAGVAADAGDDLVGDLPDIGERGGEHAGAALALDVVAAFAVEGVDARLEADATAIARRTDGGADHLRAERGAGDADGDRGRRTARRAARRARRVPGIARAARLGSGELGGHRLADDDGAGVAQRRDAGRVLFRAPAGKQRRAHFGRHVDGLDDVLDADRHAVDRRQRLAGAPARGRAVRRRPRRRPDRCTRKRRSAAPIVQQCERAFEKLPRCLLSGSEIPAAAR